MRNLVVPKANKSLAAQKKDKNPHVLNPKSLYRMEQVVELQSIITCPKCGHQKVETMPTDACVYFYECENCKEVLKPKSGDCCVYCSYGSVACPPVQEDGKDGCCLQQSVQE